MITESAKSKIILIGEHAAVYGVKAIGIPFNAYSKVTIREQKNKGILLNCRQNCDLKDKKVLLDIIKRILEKLGQKEPSLAIEIDYDIQPGLGFGLSASLSIALTKALHKFFTRPLSKTALLKLVCELENLNHGRSSGIDHNIIINDKPILFKKTANDIKIKPLIKLLNPEIFKHCYLINTGKPQESTKKMVEFVAKRLENFRQETESIFAEINELTLKVVKTSKAGDFHNFKILINKAGVLLEKLGVVSSKAKAFSSELRGSGGAVKISGAGGKTKGSGLMLVFHNDKALLKELSQKYNFELLNFRL